MPPNTFVGGALAPPGEPPLPLSPDQLLHSAGLERPKSKKNVHVAKGISISFYSNILQHPPPYTHTHI